MALALADAEYILNLRPDPSDKNFVQILTRKSSVIASLMSAQVRIDEAKLRSIRKGQMEEVLEAIKKAKEGRLN